MKKSIVCAVVCFGLSSAAIAGNTHYAAIIDAGSSGSRLHLYRYDTNTNVPTIEEVLSEKVKPGISSYADHPQQAADSLKKLLDDATQKLSELGVDTKSVDLDLMATAGMRLLPQSQQDEIYHSIQQYIATNYAFKVGEIGTITGKMEGLYGWLDVNYLTHSFEAEPYHTVGSLDMGGASTEIAFQTKDVIHQDDETTLTINKHVYTIFSKTYLGLGLDQSDLKMQASEHAAACFPYGYIINLALGAYNYAQCQDIYANIIGQFHVAEQMPDAARQPFVAYSGYYYIYNFLGALNDTSQAYVDKKANLICTLSWDQLRQRYPNDAYLSSECARAAYAADLLYNQYRISGDQLSVVNKINGKDVDWTLGALLYRLVK